MAPGSKHPVPSVKVESAALLLQCHEIQAGTFCPFCLLSPLYSSDAVLSASCHLLSSICCRSFQPWLALLVIRVHGLQARCLCMGGMLVDGMCGSLTRLWVCSTCRPSASGIPQQTSRHSTQHICVELGCGTTLFLMVITMSWHGKACRLLKDTYNLILGSSS